MKPGRVTAMTPCGLAAAQALEILAAHQSDARTVRGAGQHLESGGNQRPAAV